MKPTPLAVQPVAPQAVPLDRAYRLLNHGPTVLLSASHEGRRNVMAVAWNMALDFTPPKVAVVIDKSTFTRGLVEGSGAFVLSVPCRQQSELVTAIGNCSGKEVDKLATLDGLHYLDSPATVHEPGRAAAASPSEAAHAFPGASLGVGPGEELSTPLPLVAGCIAWLACRVLQEPAIQQRYDLFLGEVVAAWADPRVYSAGRWHFDGHDELRTIHHIAGGHYFVAGDVI